MLCNAILLQKHFIDEVKKTIGNHHSVNKQLAEGAAVLCVRLCKASTYISIHDRLNVLFSLVQSVINDLKVCIFLINWYKLGRRKRSGSVVECLTQD